MQWLIDNWSLLVIIAVVFVLGLVYVNRFVKLPLETQLKLIKMMLLL